MMDWRKLLREFRQQMQGANTFYLLFLIGLVGGVGWSLRLSPSVPDADLLDQIAEFSSRKLPFLQLVYLSGDSHIAVLVVLAVLIVLMRNRQWWTASCFALGTGGILIWIDLILKGLFARPRPLGALADAGGFSYPSGHMAGNLVLYGFVALLLVQRYPQRRGMIFTLLGTWLGFMALSCIAVRVHWPLDTLGGLATGGAWLLVVWVLYRSGLALGWSKPAKRAAQADS
jgi:membrane-associated phospholipid phosphatase